MTKPAVTRCFVTEVATLGHEDEGRTQFTHAIVVLDPTDAADLMARRRHHDKIVKRTDDGLDEMTFLSCAARFYAEPPRGLTESQLVDLRNRHWVEIPATQELKPGDEERTSTDRVVVTAVDVVWRCMGHYDGCYYQTYSIRFAELFPTRKRKEA